MAIQHLDAATIQDTVAAVFRRPEYHYAPRSLAARFKEWILEKLLTALTGVADNSWTSTIVLAAVILALVLLVGRILYEVYLCYANPYQTRSRRRASTSARDPWIVAQQLAAQGNYTDAAHALYGALISSASTSGYIVRHESKTVGDYTREIRPRIATDLFATFRQFARRYELIVYGFGRCDAEQYEQLYGMATQVADRWRRT